MPRSNLRPCVVNGVVWSQGKKREARGESFYFHRWIQEGDESEGFYIGAILETEDGQVVTIFNPSSVRFIDIEEAI